MTLAAIDAAAAATAAEGGSDAEDDLTLFGVMARPTRSGVWAISKPFMLVTAAIAASSVSNSIHPNPLWLTSG